MNEIICPHCKKVFKVEELNKKKKEYCYIEVKIEIKNDKIGCAARRGCHRNE